MKTLKNIFKTFLIGLKFLFIDKHMIYDRNIVTKKDLKEKLENKIQTIENESLADYENRLADKIIEDIKINPQNYVVKEPFNFVDNKLNFVRISESGHLLYSVNEEPLPVIAETLSKEKVNELKKIHSDFLSNYKIKIDQENINSIKNILNKL